MASAVPSSKTEQASCQWSSKFIISSGRFDYRNTTCQIYLNTDWWQIFCTCEQSLRWGEAQDQDQVTRYQERRSQESQKAERSTRGRKFQTGRVPLVQRGFILDECHGRVRRLWQRRWGGGGGGGGVGGVILDATKRENVQRRARTRRRLESNTESTLLLPETPEMCRNKNLWCCSGSL